MPDHKLELVPADELRPAAYNPRRADEERLDLVALSLSRFGWLLPIYADREGEILSGHQRHLVATERLGATVLPVVRTKKLEERRRMAVNVLYNRATNDMRQTDASAEMKVEMLEQAEAIEKARGLPALDMDTEALEPILRAERRPIAELLAATEAWDDEHGVQMAAGLTRNGLPPMPVVATSSGQVVNGRARLAYTARRTDNTDILTVEVPDEHADLVRLLLNRLSMDFALEDRFADALRYNAFRRAHNSQKYLIPCHVGHLLSGTKRDFDGSSRKFSHDNPKHVAAWKRYYGTTILDFGAGHLDQVDILLGMEVDATGFEPFYSPPGTDAVDPDASRDNAMATLARIGDGTEFDAIFLSSVLNSVPFLSDRRHIIALVAAIATDRTVMYANAASVDGQRARSYREGGASNARGSGNGAFMVDYEPNTSVADIGWKPKAQKFHSLAEWEQLWRERFKTVEGSHMLSKALVAARCRNPKPVSDADLVAACRFEFGELPMPDGTKLGLAGEAVAAFEDRLGRKLDAPLQDG